MSLGFTFIKQAYPEWSKYDDLIDNLNKNPYQKLRILDDDLVVDTRNFQWFNRWYTGDNRYTILHFIQKLDCQQLSTVTVMIELLKENYYNDRAFLKKLEQKTKYTKIIYDELPSYSELDLAKPNQKLRILNGNLKIDSRNSLMRTFSSDSRYSVLNFIKNNESMPYPEKIRILEYLKKTYRKDKKWNKLADEFNSVKSSKCYSLSVKAQLSEESKSKVLP